MEFRTVTGRYIDVGNFKPSDFDPRDAVASLCALPRFGGHTKCGYSIGVHSMLVCCLLWKQTRNQKLALAGLGHDFTETYLTDMPRPIKLLPQLEGYRQLESQLETAIFTAMNIPELVDNPAVKAADMRIYELEDMLRHRGDLYEDKPFDRTTIYLTKYSEDCELMMTMYETLSSPTLLPLEVMDKMDTLTTSIWNVVIDFVKKVQVLALEVARKQEWEIEKDLLLKAVDDDLRI